LAATSCDDRKLSLMSLAWDTDSKQGFIQAPTGLREGERKEGKTKQLILVPRTRDSTWVL
jgi:hypothetical protein